MRVHIVYRRYLNIDGNGMTVGGVQTYITNLIDVAKNLGYDVAVYQRSEQDFCVEKDGVTVYGCKYIGKKQHRLPSVLMKKYMENMNDDDILIFASDGLIRKTKGLRTAVIQHGVAWDIPELIGCSSFRFALQYVKKALVSWLLIKKYRYVDTVVCVDRNFVNWYRALVAHPQAKLTTIPNFAELPEDESLLEKPEGPVKILFARRFFAYRGTRIFTEAAKRILDEFKNVDITIAGEGPDEEFMRGELDSYENVHFIRYASENTAEVHRDKHIAVVPTVGSEGTSLSLIEAMAAKCSVICTDVGGMTDVVINGYNGIMISPDADKLYQAMKKLIENEDLRKKLAEKGYETVKESFSRDIWKKSWTEVLKDLGK